MYSVFISVFTAINMQSWFTDVYSGEFAVLLFTEK